MNGGSSEKRSRVFYIGLRGEGIPPSGVMGNFAGGFFYHILGT